MASREKAANQAAAANGLVHDQEVVRARRELAAYFKGRRTEREARSALKIIKAFIREREDTAAAKRRPLPGLKPARAIVRRKRRKISGRQQSPETSATETPNSD